VPTLETPMSPGGSQASAGEGLSPCNIGIGIGNGPVGTQSRPCNEHGSAEGGCCQTRAVASSWQPSASQHQPATPFIWASILSYTCVLHALQAIITITTPDNTLLRDWARDLPQHLAAAAAHNTTGRSYLPLGNLRLSDSVGESSHPL